MAVVKRTVLITGCSEGGIGDELCRQYHAKGLRVFATARNLKSMVSLQALGIETFSLDVTNADSISGLKKQIEELTGGTLNILVNNAGIGSPYAATDITMDHVRQLYETNVFGVMAMVKEFVSLLIASQDGCVVNVGSLSGIAPVPFTSVYGSSKAALHSYTDVLRVELAPFKVKVLLIAAGNIKSNIGKVQYRLPDDSLYKPIEAEWISARLQGFQATASPRAPMIAEIVTESLKSAPRAWLWIAFNSTVVWFVSTFLSRTAFDPIVSKRFGLTKLAQIMSAEKTSSS